MSESHQPFKSSQEHGFMATISQGSKPNHPTDQKSPRQLKSFSKLKKWLKVSLVAVVIIWFIFELVLGIVYYQKALPGTKVLGINLAGKTYAEVDQLIGQRLNKYQMTLITGEVKTIVKPDDLGISLDSSIIAKNLTVRPWYIPVSWRLLRPLKSPSLNSDTAKLNSFVASLATSVEKPAQNANLTLTGDTFTIVPEKSGQSLVKEAAEKSILNGASQLSDTIELKITVLPAKIDSGAAQTAQKSADSLTNLNLIITAAGKSFNPTKAIIASWIVFSPDTTKKILEVQIDKARLAAYVATIAAQVDIAPTNEVAYFSDGNLTKTTPGKAGQALDQAGLVQALQDKFTNRQGGEIAAKVSSLAFKKVESRTTTKVASTLTYRYCVSLKNVDESYRAEFEQNLARVYNDGNGWSLGGKVRFVQASSGCNYTAWLASAADLPGFSSGCSTMYSCRAGSNVVINFDRWQTATSSKAWDLTEYRTMVINHETGHWLGFDHLYCPGAGQSAPVMQQQSISLQGCNSNQWPTASEKKTMAGARGIGL